MKLTVLVDNNTYIDQYYLGEPGVSYYIEDGNDKILFDTGYSDILISNAINMNIDLNSIQKIVFSHGHDDHTGGFKFLAQKYDMTDKEIIAHPDCFYRKVYEGESCGTPFSLKEMKEKYKLNLSDKPIKISENITFLGEIPNSNDFERVKTIGQREKDGVMVDDIVIDDTAIVYKNTEGIFIITGCSHSGICNIIEYAKKVCNETRIIGIIGGFHLFRQDETFQKTMNYLKEQKIEIMYPCHCISLGVKAKLYNEMKIKEIGVGKKIEIK